MKLLIVTIVDYKNYGNRLQNYALTTLLKELGCEVTSGLDVYERHHVYRWLDSHESKPSAFIKKHIPWRLYSIHSKRREQKRLGEVNPLLLQRIQKSKAFTEDYTATIPPLYVKDEADLRRQLRPYGFDFFVAGSDQVWNPHYAGRDPAFLTFAPPEKRLSFAASFGVTDIPEAEKERFQRNLSRMCYLSVREQDAGDLVFRLIGRKADVTLDPTLLLSQDAWKRVETAPDIPLPQHYIAGYFLGGIPAAAEEFAKKHGLQLLQLNSMDFPALFAQGPREFLYILSHADCVLTDSFHAVSFCLKFKKDFYVFPRKQAGAENMFSRISSLLERFDLPERAQGRDAIHEQPPVSSEKWAHIAQLLRVEKERTMQKLSDIIKS